MVNTSTDFQDNQKFVELQEQNATGEVPESKVKEFARRFGVKVALVLALLISKPDPAMSQEAEDQVADKKGTTEQVDYAEMDTTKYLTELVPGGVSAKELLGLEFMKFGKKYLSDDIMGNTLKRIKAGNKFKGAKLDAENKALDAENKALDAENKALDVKNVELEVRDKKSTERYNELTRTLDPTKKKK